MRSNLALIGPGAGTAGWGGLLYHPPGPVGIPAGSLPVQDPFAGSRPLLEERSQDSGAGPGSPQGWSGWSWELGRTWWVGRVVPSRYTPGDAPSPHGVPAATGCSWGHLAGCSRAGAVGYDRFETPVGEPRGVEHSPVLGSQAGIYSI